MAENTPTKEKEFLDKIKQLEANLAIDSKKSDLKEEDLKKAQKQERSLEEQKQEAELKRYNHDTSHRNGLIIWAATVVSLWLLCVIFIITGNSEKYKLSDTIMVTLLTTTTVNVLGLMIIVLNDLFRGKANKD